MVSLFCFCCFEQVQLFPTIFCSCQASRAYPLLSSCTIPSQGVLCGVFLASLELLLASFSIVHSFLSFQNFLIAKGTWCLLLNHPLLISTSFQDIHYILSLSSFCIISSSLFVVAGRCDIMCTCSSKSFFSSHWHFPHSCVRADQLRGMAFPCLYVTFMLQCCSFKIMCWRLGGAEVRGFFSMLSRDLWLISAVSNDP